MHKDNEDEYELFKIMRSEDQIGAVIRANLWVEAQLFEILEKRTRRDLKEKRFTYEQKVFLTCALKLVPGDLEEALKMLGKFRNDIAHKIGAVITDAQQDDFLKKIPNTYKKKIADIISDFPVSEQDTNSNVRHLKGLKGRRAVSSAFASGIFVLVYALWEVLADLEADSDADEQLDDE